MKIKSIVIDSKYNKDRETINDIISGKVKNEQTFCDQRNKVWLVSNGESKWVVKKFKRPTLANCVIYTLLRPSKAKRAFDYAYRLLDNDIDTAHPVAYIEIYKHGFFHTGYYISEYVPLPGLDNINGLDDNETDKLLTDLAAFTARMHGLGIVDFDYNVSNILWNKGNDGHYHFTLIDINRTRFNCNHLLECAIALTTNALLDRFVDRYCEMRGIDKALFDKMLELGYKRIHSRNKAHKRLKRFVKTLTSFKSKG